MKKPGDASPVTLITPSYWRDVELCELLCESVDRYAAPFARHVLIVADADLAVFAKFEGARREVLPASQFLPRWLRPLPRFMQRGGRRYWWSLRSKPVSGWHVQQLIKFAAAATLPGERFCILDSDVAFFRPFDLSLYRRPHPIPLFYAPAAIAAWSEEDQSHAEWIRSTHRLLGLGEPEFPADDFIGHVIPWDQGAVRAMLARIESVTGLEWADALCRAREFSEYLLYGFFVRNDPAHAAQHRPSTELPCVSYWRPEALDLAGIRSFIATAGDHSSAFSAASLSNTPVALVRQALAGHAASQERMAQAARKVQAV